MSRYVIEDWQSVPNLAQALILIVDSHAAIRTALIGLLGSAFPACRFQEAVSGEDAFAIVVNQPADIVIVAFQLPHMNGVEVTRRLKAISPTTQVVIMSFDEAPHYRVDSEAAGASVFVPLRTVHSELIPILASLLAKAAEKNARDEPAR